MANKTLVVIGKGYLGSRIAEHFNSQMQVITVDMPEVDITDQSSLAKIINEHEPSIVINAAAMADTHAVQKYENRKAAYAVNVQGPANLAYLAHRHGFTLVHISSAMVFAGKKGVEYTETDGYDPISYYAWTKAWADAQLTPFLERDNILITRIHLPVSSQSHPRNLLNKLATFSSFVDAENSMTVIEDYLEALDQLLQKNAHGIYHVTNPGSISFYTIAQRMQQHGLIKTDQVIEKITEADLQKSIAEKGGAQQVNVVLNTDKLQALGIKMRPITEAIDQSLQELETT